MEWCVLSYPNITWRQLWTNLKDYFIEISERKWWRDLEDSLFLEVSPLNVLDVEAVDEKESGEAQHDFQNHFAAETVAQVNLSSPWQNLCTLYQYL